MKRSLLAIVLAMATLIAGSAVASAGNDAPQGSHEYQLNIIGVDKAKNPDMDGNNGHRIFVPLQSKTKIYLSEGDYGVIDANGTDGSAEFSLPAPGYDACIVDVDCVDQDSSYSVFIRSLGKPGGFAEITTCAQLLDSTIGGMLPGGTLSGKNRVDGDATCSLEQVGQEITMRTKGKSNWTNVTAELTSVVFEIEVCDEECEYFEVRVPIFDDSLQGEYWEYDNKGLRLLQVRFYDCSTNMGGDGSTC